MTNTIVTFSDDCPFADAVRAKLNPFTLKSFVRCLCTVRYAAEKYGYFEKYTQFPDDNTAISVFYNPHHGTCAVTFHEEA